jgi:hypothetical protein
MIHDCVTVLERHVGLVTHPGRSSSYSFVYRYSTVQYLNARFSDYFVGAPLLLYTEPIASIALLPGLIALVIAQR